MRRPALVGFVQRMAESFPYTERCEELIAVDSMPLTVAKTQRHHLQKYNDQTVGGGVLWAYRVEARQGESPVRVLRIMRGAWNDSHQMSGVALQPDGPVYLFDRGFFSYARIRDWLTGSVRFILRIRAATPYMVLRELSPRRRLPDMELLFDGEVRLKGRKADGQRVRLIGALPDAPGREALWLVTSECDWPAERVLDSYQKRWKIEQFHRFLKTHLGLAHLYSLDERGVDFLLFTAILLSNLLLADDPQSVLCDTIALLHAALNALQHDLDLPRIWKRNMSSYHRRRKRSRQNLALNQ